jgi:hypothetical protein
LYSQDSRCPSFTTRGKKRRGKTWKGEINHTIAFTIRHLPL